METQLSPIGRFERTLLTTDCSEFSAGAVRVALKHAQKCGGKLYVMSMVITNPEVEALAPHIIEEQEQQTTKCLDDICHQAKELRVKHEVLLRHGSDPYQEIVDVAEELQVDLIVMGRRGRRGLARMMVGDATAKVIGHAKCNVLVAPRAAQMCEKHILLAIDGSRYSDAAAAAVANLGKACNLPVTVLSVAHPNHNEPRRQIAYDAVKRVSEFLSQDGIQVDSQVLEGKAETVIVETAKKIGADLIVLGSHGRTGLERILLGSVSERVIGLAEGLVLVAKL